MYEIEAVKNVLVLGSNSDKIIQFVKLFGGYLKYDSYEEAIKFHWQSNLTENKDIEKSSMLIRNKKFNFICTQNLDIKNVTKQNISFLLFFMQKQPISAIIFLEKSTEVNDERDRKYNSCFLSKLKQYDFPNILHIFELNNDFYENQLATNSFCKERSEFYFQQDTFYKNLEDNWIENTSFCKSVYNYIVGQENTNAMQDFYIQSMMPIKIVSKLADDILELLIQIYMSVEFCNLVSLLHDDYYYVEFSIIDYKSNSTICYGNNCIEWREDGLAGELIKIPKTCHDLCNCTKYNNDIGKCKIFKISDGKCLECNCNIQTHSKLFFNYDICHHDYSPHDDFYSEVNKEKNILLNTLATLSLYKKQNQEVYSYENILNRLLNMENEIHQAMFNNLTTDLNQEFQNLENKCNLITNEDILIGIKNLYLIKDAATIIPKFIEEIFPADFQLELIRENESESNKGTYREMSKINNEKIKMLTDENKRLKSEIAEIKNMLQNSNDLNLKLTQDRQIFTKRRKLNEIEEDSKGETV